MEETYVHFTPYAKHLMAKRGLKDEDETLIAAVLRSDPLGGRVVVSKCEAYRVRQYPAVANTNTRKHDVFYVYFPNSDIQLNGRDILIVVSVDEPNSLSGQRLDPEGVARLLEVIAELTRHVFG